MLISALSLQNTHKVMGVDAGHLRKHHDANHLFRRAALPIHVLLRKYALHIR